MGETTIRIAVAAGLGVALVGIRDAGPAAIGALYVAVVTIALVQNDLRDRRLPNALVLPGAAFVTVGVAWSALGGTGGYVAELHGPVASGATVAVAAFVCGLSALAVFAILASGGGLGMGDVKLAAVLAAALAAVVAERGPPLGAVVVVVAWWAAASLVAGALIAGSELRRGSGPLSDVPFGPVLLALFWVFVLTG